MKPFYQVKKHCKNCWKNNYPMRAEINKHEGSSRLASYGTSLLERMKLQFNEKAEQVLKQTSKSAIIDAANTSRER